MHIGYISYEHPLGIAGGGIGTYLGQIARLMAARGHEVQVFTGHPQFSDSFEHDGYSVHRVQAQSVQEFREKVVAPFARRHLTNEFDILESGEFGADAFFVKKQFPAIPLTVKLHTPTFLVTRLNSNPFSNVQKAIFLLKCLRKGIIQKPFWIYEKKADPEYQLFQMADSLSSPSNSLKGIVEKEWGRKGEIEVLPLPFEPSAAFLSMPSVKKPQDKTVICFVGKLEVRKGVLSLMKAIPEVVKHAENVVFRFIGEPLPSPRKGLNMQEYISSELADFPGCLQFMGKQPAAKIPELLADVHICVFPSLWENFPNVCLEAMAAGKLVIGTDNGGMGDMISHGKNGLLVAPNSPDKLARLLTDVLQDVYDIETIGREARQRILSTYNHESIGKLTENFYQKTIRKTTAISVL
ncbi:MAG: glycosyltransferase family 1 protein [Chitinophagaceae bacterium]|nr:MAG: glycosyltransferase family 1 protein [Chitinophagaceae bacterium]